MSWKSENLALISSYLGSPEKRFALPFVHFRLEIAAHRRPDAAERARWTGVRPLKSEDSSWDLKIEDYDARSEHCRWSSLAQPRRI